MKKIIVIGSNRSGTKWLSNIIANHTKVSTIQCQDDTGVIESNMFFYYPKIFKDLSRKENKSAFEILFKNSNYFKSSKLNEKDLEKIKTESIVEYYLQFMQLYTESDNNEIWLQKTSAIHFYKYIKYFDNTKFIIIRRNPLDTIISHIGLDVSRNNKPKIFRHVYIYILNKKTENKFLRKQSLYVEFENLKKRPQSICETIFEFLNLEFSKELLNSKYRKNTSFKNLERKTFISSKIKLKIKFYSFLFSLIPWKVLMFFYGVITSLNKLKSNSNIVVNGTFSLYRKSHK